MKSVTLFGYANSPYVRKTACFLYYKGIEFEHAPVNPIEPDKTIGFTNGTRVPVLKIDDDWKLESSEHAYWLDEIFPEKPLCPSDHKHQIESIDKWISNTFLTSIFRQAIDGEFDLRFRYRAWRLAALISAHTPLPEEIRNFWPDALRTVPFIQEMSKHINLEESHEDMKVRIRSELVEHIGDGPFIGGFEQPTMLDFAVYPNAFWHYMYGVEEEMRVGTDSVTKSWLQRVSKHLPNNPWFTPDYLIVNPLQECIC